MDWLTDVEVVDARLYAADMRLWSRVVWKVRNRTVTGVPAEPLPPVCDRVYRANRAAIRPTQLYCRARVRPESLHVGD